MTNRITEMWQSSVQLGGGGLTYIKHIETVN